MRLRKYLFRHREATRGSAGFGANLVWLVVVKFAVLLLTPCSHCSESEIPSQKSILQQAVANSQSSQAAPP
ncbi:hypothetical protein BDV06DRAFT_202818, partial [Aspergillus oleicola]